jgi:anti-anti-sigma factor
MTDAGGARRFATHERDERGVRIIGVTGELDLDSAPELAARIDAARAATARRVLVDLSDLGFCDSTGLRALMGAANEIRIAGGRLALSCPHDTPVARTLSVTGAREMLPVYPDVTTALAALRDGGVERSGA